MATVGATLPRPAAPDARAGSLGVPQLRITEAGAMPADAVLRGFAAAPDGLTSTEAARRLAVTGPNAVRSHGARWPAVLLRQVRSPLLLLLLIAAVASFFVGERTDSIIIGVIIALSIGLGFLNEYRAERAAEALHSQVRHTAVAVRDGSPVQVDVTTLVPGDVLELALGEVVPADVRLMSASGLECDETVLTGESLPVAKHADAVPPGTALADLTSCALMGTVVRAGSGRGVVTATGSAAEFGRIALQLGEGQAATEFQLGLRRFSGLLVRVAAALTTFVLVANVALARPVLDAILFSLAIAVGITPQLLPAVVSTSLAAGSRRLARRKVLVKRLVCIEDLGNIQVLLTDKTGTLTDGEVGYLRALGVDGNPSDQPLLLGLVCNEASVGAGGAVGGNALDVALWRAPAAAPYAARVAAYRRLAVLPFDHDRRLVSVVADDPADGAMLVTKGAPEAVLERCTEVPDAARAALEAEFRAGSRVVAVAWRAWAGGDELTPDDERSLTFVGLLVFRDPPKPTAGPALRRLAALGVEVKVVTGDNALVATRVCADLGLPVAGVLTGPELDRLDDDTLAAAVAGTTVFARVSPEHKARIVRAQRQAGVDVAFLGDGVNDAVALHAADVGISVDAATDVAKNAADILLLEKDLAVLADGVVEGRRIFANTIKYVLMGTSSNFGNMVSAAGASAVLSFLPMLPSQVLLNNLLYDTSQLAIPTDTVDAEQVVQPTRWDLRLIRRYMLVFGPASSLFDFATFAVMLWGFHASAALFRTGWFVESLATQTLVIFVIRTHRSPFFLSRPSGPLLAAALSVVVIGALLPFAPFAHDLGFRPLPGGFFLALAGTVVAYLLLVEAVKRRFFGTPHRPRPIPRARHPQVRQLHRRAARFSSPRIPLGRVVHRPPAGRWTLPGRRHPRDARVEGTVRRRSA